MPDEITYLLFVGEYVAPILYRNVYVYWNWIQS
jgi:hypothetical protein